MAARWKCQPRSHRTYRELILCISSTLPGRRRPTYRLLPPSGGEFRLSCLRSTWISASMTGKPAPASPECFSNTCRPPWPKPPRSRGECFSTASTIAVRSPYWLRETEEPRNVAHRNGEHAPAESAIRNAPDFERSSLGTNQARAVVRNAVDVTLFAYDAVKPIEEFRDSVMCVGRIEGVKCELQSIAPSRAQYLKLVLIREALRPIKSASTIRSSERQAQTSRCLGNCP